jgi:hypothetical protein
VLFQLYNLTGKASWYDAGNAYAAALADNQNNTGTHDVGASRCRGARCCRVWGGADPVD